MQRKKWILDEDRGRVAVTVEMPEDVILDLKLVARHREMEGIHELIRYYVGKGLKDDLETLRVGCGEKSESLPTTAVWDASP